MRLTAGLAIRISSGHATPDQYSIAKKIPMKTIPLPRSGCAMIIAHGMTTRIAGFHRSSSERGVSRRADRTLASISTTVIFAISDGCPTLTPPIASQLLVLRSEERRVGKEG